MKSYQDIEKSLNDMKINRQATYQLLDILGTAGLKEAILAKKGFILSDKIHDLLLNINIINNSKKVEVLEAFFEVTEKNLDELVKKLEKNIKRKED